MRPTMFGIAALFAVSLSLFPFGAQAACDEHAAAETADSVAMGPDPGGKSGDTVTPDTTKTDHPADRKDGAGTDTGRSNANKAHDDSTGPTSGPTPQLPSPRGEPDASGNATR
jgi:hypothetical protein